MADPIPTLGEKIRSTFLSVSSRTRVGYVAEADVSTHASSSKSYLRGPENSECDIVVITGIKNPQNIPDNPTDRFQAFKRRYEGKMLRNAVYMEIKSFQFMRLHATATTRQHYTRNLCPAHISMTHTQIQKCQVIIVTSLLDPDWVAVIPRPYLANNIPRTTSTAVVLGASVTPAIARMCPLPAEIAPFIMPISFLGQAMDSIAASATDIDTQVYNPFTGFTYARCASWQPKLAYFDDILPSANATEFRLRQQILEAFKARGQSTNLTVQTPYYVPLTSDLKIEHTSGQFVLVEFKIGCVRVKDGPNGTTTLEHLATTTTGRSLKGVFTFMAPWDYLFTLPETRSSYALMIKKADWPRSFWHSLPNTQDERLAHEYPDTAFINAHKVRLNAGQATLVQDICSIILSQGVPQKGGLTAAEIVEFAGPCPPSMLTTQELRQARTAVDLDASDPDIVTEDEVGNEGRDDDESDEAGDATAGESADEEEEAEVERGKNFLAKTQDMRVSLSSRREMVRISQLFDSLMSESRHKGYGCPIFLGFNHPEGNIGFVRYKWTEADKRAFDKKDKAPCWIGNLPNETPMITLLPQHSQWRMDYAPSEGTLGELAALRQAGSCLLVCTSPHREFAHHKQYVWLIPSEYVPKVNLGSIKRVSSTYFKTPMFLEDKSSIHKFIVDNTELHGTLLEFLSSKEIITIGHGEVELRPYQYLKTVGAHRISTDVNMDLCFGKLNAYRPLD